MSAHSPGPWRDVAIGGAATHVEDATGDAVAYGPTRLANGRLIAAAPELLEALEEAIPEAEEGGARDHLLAEWRALIARVRGT